jgi:hypothetical protein
MHVDDNHGRRSMNETTDIERLAEELASVFWEQTDLSDIQDQWEAKSIAEERAADFLIRCPELWRPTRVDPERFAVRFAEVVIEEMT